MKKLQRFCAAVALTLAFAFSASAGDILGPGVVSQPPPPQQQSSATCEIEMPGAAARGDMLAPGVTAFDPVTEAALSLLQSILSLF